MGVFYSRPEDYKLVDAGNEVEADKENIVIKELDIAGTR